MVSILHFFRPAMCARRNDDLGSAGNWRPTRDNGAPRPGEVELRVHEALTCRTAPAFCRAAGGRMRETPRFGLRPPSWEELAPFERWANDPLLEQMVGSQLLYRCRHLGPYHPDFAAQVLHDPTALTLLVLPLDEPPEPVGFVRLYNVQLAEAFAFLETAV